MQPVACPKCGGSITTLWRPTQKHSRHRGYYTVHVPVYACLECMLAVRIFKLDPKKLVAKKPSR